MDISVPMILAAVLPVLAAGVIAALMLCLALCVMPGRKARPSPPQRVGRG